MTGNNSIGLGPDGGSLKRIKVIIVTYNSADCIGACLQALQNASEQFELHTVIVDNASSDNTLCKVESLYSDIEIIRSTENLGYAHGNNIGIKAMSCENMACAAVLILNPDVILTPGSIDELAAVLHYSPEVGAVSPNISEHGSLLDTSVRFKSLIGWPMQQKFMSYRNVIEVDRLYGCCMLIKPNLFKNIGLFDEAYFLYWEEIDLCFRALKAGFKLLICKNVSVQHRRGGEERRHRIYYMWRNQYYFAFKTYGRIKGTLFLARRILTNTKEILLFIYSKRFDLIVAALSGMRAGIVGEKGYSPNQYAAPSNETEEGSSEAEV